MEKILELSVSHEFRGEKIYRRSPLSQSQTQSDCQSANRRTRFHARLHILLLNRVCSEFARAGRVFTFSQKRVVGSHASPPRRSMCLASMRLCNSRRTEFTPTSSESNMYRPFFGHV